MIKEESWYESGKYRREGQRKERQDDNCRETASGEPMSRLQLGPASLGWETTLLLANTAKTWPRVKSNRMPNESQREKLSDHFVKWYTCVLWSETVYGRGSVSFSSNWKCMWSGRASSASLSVLVTPLTFKIVVLREWCSDRHIEKRRVVLFLLVDNNLKTLILRRYWTIQSTLATASLF